MSVYISIYLLLLYIYVSIPGPIALRMNAFSGVRSLVLCNAVISTEATWVPEGGGTHFVTFSPLAPQNSLCATQQSIYIYIYIYFRW